MTDPIVQTTAGQVRGAVSGGVARFLGVPYAAPPVGARRFSLPEPPQPWTGVREATDPGPTPPQLHEPFTALDIAPLVGSGWIPGDDYLTLNVWAPAQAQAADGLPVMVFIHGGAFIAGHKDSPVHDGNGFARSGVICIAINYRLGVEGFLPIVGAPTNLGLRDQIAALKWVQANAAAFGGDPSRVTVFGESAGAMSIADLVASPLAKGLFSRAIIESGHGSMVRTVKVTRRVVKRLARMLRITADVAGFRSRTVEQTTAALHRLSQPSARIDLRDQRRREPAFGLARLLPVLDDDVIPELPLQALARGAGAGVEVLIGSNSEEMNLYFVPTGVLPKLRGWLAILLLGRVIPHARAALKAYGLGLKGRTAGEAFAAAMTDLVFRWPARQFAAAHQGRTHVYEFDWRSPACDGGLGACHAMELPFVFDTLACATGPKGVAGENPPQDLADRIHALWVSFARGEDLPWPEYSSDDRQVYSLVDGAAAPEPVMPAAAFL